MIVQFLFVLAILAAAGVVYGLVLARSSRGKGVIADTVEAWRAEDRQLDEFDVTMRDTSVGDVFSAFPEDTSPYVTPETVEGGFTRMVGAGKGTPASGGPSAGGAPSPSRGLAAGISTGNAAAVASGGAVENGAGRPEAVGAAGRPRAARLRRTSRSRNPRRAPSPPRGPPDGALAVTDPAPIGVRLRGPFFHARGVLCVPEASASTGPCRI